jgi:hypothetical protein
VSCFRSSLSTTPVTSCCQTTGRIDASLRGQRAGGDRSLAVKLEPGKPSGDQAPIVFAPVEPTCLRSAGHVQALVAASCDRQVSTPHVFGPVYPPHLLRWRALRLRPQLSYWAIMHLFCTEATHALELLITAEAPCCSRI